MLTDRRDFLTARLAADSDTEGSISHMTDDCFTWRDPGPGSGGNLDLGDLEPTAIIQHK